jgi:hypothetical protein
MPAKKMSRQVHLHTRPGRCAKNYKHVRGVSAVVTPGCDEIYSENTYFPGKRLLVLPKQFDFPSFLTFFVAPFRRTASAQKT